MDLLLLCSSLVYLTDAPLSSWGNRLLSRGDMRA